ncbi:MAG: TPM domain-containing protein, partial [Acidimicrobiia bacterium]
MGIVPNLRSRLHSLLWLTVSLLLVAGPAAAQDSPTCPEFEGFTCDGFVTDVADVIEEDEVLESEAARIEGLYGAQVAVVLVPSIGGWSIKRFAQELGDTWGVGSSERDDGVVVIVDVGGRNTWVELGDGLNDFPRDPSDLAALGNSGFRNGNFDAGVLAILAGLGDGFEAYANGERAAETNWGVIGGVVGLAALGVVGFVVAGVRRQNNRRTRRRRAELVDGELERLEIAGHELPLIAEYSGEPPETAPDIPTINLVDALNSVARGEVPRDQDAVTAAWALGMLDIIDRDRLL